MTNPMAYRSKVLRLGKPQVSKGKIWVSSRKIKPGIPISESSSNMAGRFRKVPELENFTGWSTIFRETRNMVGTVSGWWWLEPWNFEWLSIYIILGIIIPTDFHIFQRGRYTTIKGYFLWLLQADSWHFRVMFPSFPRFCPATTWAMPRGWGSLKPATPGPSFDPLAIKHNYGKSPFLMGNFSINGHFQ
jgi:hypothetical protein